MDVLVKERIVELRRRGTSYKQISETTGVPTGSVKTICRRTPADDDLRQEGLCDQCREPLKADAQSRRFCSAKCRLNWWHAHPERLNRRAIYTFTCAGCQDQFSAYGNKARKYCTHACYVQTRFGTRGGRA